jgi:hypothetical protein
MNTKYYINLEQRAVHRNLDGLPMSSNWQEITKPSEWTTELFEQIMNLARSDFGVHDVDDLYEEIEAI